MNGADIVMLLFSKQNYNMDEINLLDDRNKKYVKTTLNLVENELKYLIDKIKLSQFKIQDYCGKAESIENNLKFFSRILDTELGQIEYLKSVIV